MSIKKNFAYNFIYQIFILIVPLITMPYVSRVIGAEGIGIYSYTHAVANYFVIFAMLGLNNYGNRSIAKVRDNKEVLSQTFWSIYFLQLITSAIAILSYFIYLFVIGSPHYLISIIQLIFVLSTVLDINWLFFGLEKFKLTVIRSTIVKLITLVLIFLFVKSESDFIIYSIIMASSFFISQLLLWPYLKKMVLWKRPTCSEIFQHFKPNLTLFLPVIAISLYRVMDKIMIGKMSEMAQLGYFVNAESINHVQISLVTALGTVMLPRMSNLIANNNTGKLSSLIRDSMQFVLLLSIALCFGTIAIAHDFILIYLGPKFLDSANILIILAVTGVIMAWANVIRTQYIIPNHKDKIYIFSVFLGALVNFSLNLILIPKFGAVGAALGSILAECSVMMYQTMKVRNELNIKQYLNDSIIFIPIGILMLIGVKVLSVFLETSIIGIIIQVLFGATIYILLTMIYFTIFKKERLLYFIRVIKK